MNISCTTSDRDLTPAPSQGGEGGREAILLIGRYKLTKAGFILTKINLAILISNRVTLA